MTKTTRRCGSASNKNNLLEKSDLHTYPNLDIDISKWLSPPSFDNTPVVTKTEVVIDKTGIWCI